MSYLVRLPIHSEYVSILSSHTIAPHSAYALPALQRSRVSASFRYGTALPLNSRGVFSRIAGASARAGRGLSHR